MYSKSSDFISKRLKRTGVWWNSSYLKESYLKPL
jgi:hypothetical protein